MPRHVFEVTKWLARLCLSVVSLRLPSVALTEERDSLVRPYSTLVNPSENSENFYN